MPGPFMMALSSFWAANRHGTEWVALLPPDEPTLEERVDHDWRCVKEGDHIALDDVLVTEFPTLFQRIEGVASWATP